MRPGYISFGASRELETTSAPWLPHERNCPELERAWSLPAASTSSQQPLLHTVGSGFLLPGWRAQTLLFSAFPRVHGSSHFIFTPLHFRITQIQPHPHYHGHSSNCIHPSALCLHHGQHTKQALALTQVGRGLTCSGHMLDMSMSVLYFLSALQHDLCGSPYISYLQFSQHQAQKGP